MTDAELDRLEALFRNPPSHGVLAEHGLTLVAELRALRHPTVEQAIALVMPPPIPLVASIDPLQMFVTSVDPLDIVEPKPAKKKGHK